MDETEPHFKEVGANVLPHGCNIQNSYQTVWFDSGGAAQMKVVGVVNCAHILLEVLFLYRQCHLVNDHLY